MTKILAGALGDCVHVAGVVNFLRLAEELGCETIFTGPATSVEDFLAAAHREAPDILAVSYRLTPANAWVLLSDLQEAAQDAGLADRRFIFGGTPPVADAARQLGYFEATFDGHDPPEALVAYLKGEPLTSDEPDVYPDEVIPRIEWKAPFPILRHHFGLPHHTIEPTVDGISTIAEARVLDVVSLGADQDAQEHFFHPERQDPRSKGAGGVPFRTEADLEQLYAATRRGNYPLMRSYSGTSDHIRYAEALRRTIGNAWCATSLFWFNDMDGRGPSPLTQSIGEHIELMAWHGARGIPVEGNEPYHWGLRDAHDVIVCAASYIYAHVAKRARVRDYITTYMFETPPHLSDAMDLAKALAQVRLAESFADEDFRIWRQTRTGLFSCPLEPAAARAHLAGSVYRQMALRPSIVHVVGYTEADHAATAEEVIESCRMAHQSIETALRGAPDPTADPRVQRRAGELVEETMVLIEAIRQLGTGVDDPLSDPDTLARAVKVGLLDAPHLINNPYAPGRLRTQAVGGAIVAVDESQQPLSERERIARIFDDLEGHK